MRSGSGTRLGHSFAGQVMNASLQSPPVLTPQSHDIADRRLVGAVDNVFVGHVIAQVGTTPSGDVPETQFAVEVVESIKGTLRGKVIVNQEGGMQGVAPILFDHDPLLKPGATYLFATRLYKETSWQTLVPNYGDLQVKDAQDQDAVIERFKKATQQQITPYPVPSKG
jgi:hypothetical protein